MELYKNKINLEFLTTKKYFFKLIKTNKEDKQNENIKKLINLKNKMMIM